MNPATIPHYPVTIEGATAEVGTANELAITLDVLQGNFDRAVLEQLRPHLADIVAASGGLSLTLKSLSAADQIYLIEALGSQVAGLMRSAAQLRDLLAGMAHVEAEGRLLDALGSDGLRSLVVTAEELAEVLEWIYGQCDRQALNLIGADALRRMFHSGQELSLVLHSLDETLQAELIDLLGWDRVAGLMRDGRDLAYVLRALSPEYSRELLGRFSRQQLSGLIGNQRDWEYLYNRLEASEAEIVCQLLGVDRYAA